MIDNWKMAKSTSDYLKINDFFQRSKNEATIDSLLIDSYLIRKSPDTS